MFYYNILLEFVICIIIALNLFLCLIYKLNFTIGKHVEKDHSIHTVQN